MTDVFDFMEELEPYGEKPNTIFRLVQRHRLIIDPFAEQIADARILDLAAHDGRWSYALANAGAKNVIGVEARQELIDRFVHFPQTDVKSRVTLIQNDLYAELEARVIAGETFDVVAVYGIFYHIMDHFRLLSLVEKLKPTLVIIDSEFIKADNAIVQVLKEEISNPLNAVSDIPDVTHTVVGVPSKRTMQFMAEALRMDLTWVDHDLILEGDQTGMSDYYREGRKARFACALTPIGA
ncbi:MAG: class I SAM-dependent methyltransferase [Pseudomonadota bacterium]